MPPRQPELGSLAIQAPTLAPQTVHVTPSTCHDLSVFKGELQVHHNSLAFDAVASIDLMKEYRKLDDSITMRYNRTTAQFRDRDRLGLGKGNVQDQACAHLWKELVGMSLKVPTLLISLAKVRAENWKRRTDIIEYCVGVVDISLDEKRRELSVAGSDTATARKMKGALYAEEVKVS